MMRQYSVVTSSGSVWSLFWNWPLASVASLTKPSVRPTPLSTGVTPLTTGIEERPAAYFCWIAGLIMKFRNAAAASGFFEVLLM